MSPRLLLWVRRLVVLVSIVGFAWVLWDGFRSGTRLPPDTLRRLALAIPLSVLGLGFAAVSWSELAGIRWRQGVYAFGASLPIRHLPLGGLGQVAGMTGLAVAGGAATRRAAQAAPLFLFVTAVGASIVSVPVVWDAEVPSSIRVFAGIAMTGSLAVLTAGRSAMRLLARWWAPAKGGEDLPILRAVGWSALATASAGLAFAVLFTSGSPIQSATRFAVAWLGGFLFVVAPAGLGAREALLVSMWPGVSSAEVLAVALLHRISTLAAEGLMLLVGLLLSRSGQTRLVVEEDVN